MRRKKMKTRSRKNQSEYVSLCMKSQGLRTGS